MVIQTMDVNHVQKIHIPVCTLHLHVRRVTIKPVPNAKNVHRQVPVITIIQMELQIVISRRVPPAVIQQVRLYMYLIVIIQIKIPQYAGFFMHCGG